MTARARAERKKETSFCSSQTLVTIYIAALSTGHVTVRTVMVTDQNVLVSEFDYIIMFLTI